MSVQPYEEDIKQPPEQKGRFLNYQRLLENTLATWIRNGFISTTTGLVLIPHDKEISHCIFVMSTMIFIYSGLDYYNNQKKLQERAPNGFKIDKDHVWLLVSVLLSIIHIIFMLRRIFF